jgi:hypothetical protein
MSAVHLNDTNPFSSDIMDRFRLKRALHQPRRISVQKFSVSNSAGHFIGKKVSIVWKPIFSKFQRNPASVFYQTATFLCMLNNIVMFALAWWRGAMTITSTSGTEGPGSNPGIQQNKFLGRT